MFDGSLVALVTPMFEDGAIDEAGLASLVEFHVRNGSNSIIAVGTTGESATVDEEEHCRLIRLAVRLAAGRLPVIAGTGANSTREAIELTECAKDAGADACLLVTPYYNKPTQEGLFLHHRAVAEAVDIPQILYNVPGRTACDMQPATVLRLSVLDNIVGIKEATGKIERVREIRQGAGPDFGIWSGDDATGLEAMLNGANGVISVTANLAPAAMHQMCELALAGQADAAAAINERLADLHRDLFVESNPIPVKWALAEMGLIRPGIRLPLTPLSDAYHPVLRAAMVRAGLLEAA